METLELKDLPIDRFDPCVDIKIILHTREHVKQIKSYIIESLSVPDDVSQQLRIENKQEEGIHIHLINKDLGGRLSIKINDALSEQRSQRGILANLMDATTPEELKNSIDYILLQPGNIFNNATEELLQPPIHVFTADGKREIELPMNATALDFAAKIHPEILIGAQRAFIGDNTLSNRQPYPLFDPLPNGVTVFIESCLKKQVSMPQNHPQVLVNPGWPIFCKNRHTKELLTQYLQKDKKKSVLRGKQFIRIVSSMLQLSQEKVISLVQKNISKGGQAQNIPQIQQDIGETKIDLIAVLSKEEKYMSSRWNIAVIIPDRPGELDHLLDHFKQICNITDIQIQTVQQEEKSKEVTLHLDFTPPELPEYKRLKPYQVLTTFLKLHYEGYDIHVLHS